MGSGPNNRALNQQLLSLPDDASTQERELINRVSKENGVDQGSLRTQIAAFASGKLWFLIY